jgi:myo-inositol-1(or 4)-monophosphatase
MACAELDGMLERMERVACEAILAAGRLLRESFGKPRSFSIQSKQRFDYVTDVDRNSEDLIIATIHEHFPEHQILAEESASSVSSEAFTWVIDPLDGTTNFIHGFPLIAISIAVMMHRDVLFGYVYDPLRGELFSARKGGGAYLNGQAIRVSDPSLLPSPLVATGFPFRSRELLQAYLETFTSIFLAVGGIRRGGSAALDLAYLAAGRVDGFWEIGLKPWDVAAGSLLVQEAGGLVSDFWGRGDFIRNGHIVAGEPSIYPFLLDQVKTRLAPRLQA